MNPLKAAWDYGGSDFVGEDDDDDDVAASCGESSGCQLLEREEAPHGFSREREHVAGPGCISHYGYSGHRISLKEMKGCRGVQCLMKKKSTWEPEPDDQDFELGSDYFLSGVGDGSPDESPLENIEPPRHDIDNVIIQNYNYAVSLTLLIFNNRSVSEI